MSVRCWMVNSKVCLKWCKALDPCVISMRSSAKVLGRALRCNICFIQALKNNDTKTMEKGQPWGMPQR
eukprot:4340866-Karenia_brevis.AAC.1